MRERITEVQDYARKLLSCIKKDKEGGEGEQKRKPPYTIHDDKISFYKMRKKRLIHSYEELMDFR